MDDKMSKKFQILCLVTLTLILSGCSSYLKVVERNERDKKRSIQLQNNLNECQRNNANRCTSLGSHYQNSYSKNRKPDYKKALFYYSKACSLGDPQGCYFGGSLYQRHKGTEDLSYVAELTSGTEKITLNRKDADYVMARNLFKRGCDSKRSRNSCGSLAGMYVRGNGGEKDLTEARSYYQLQCPKCSKEEIESKINSTLQAYEEWKIRQK